MAKTKKQTAAKETTKPLGIIGTIEKCVRKATKTKPVSKDQILKVLIKQFPERDAEAMTKTINCQLPGRMARERGFSVHRTEDLKFYSGRK